MTFVGDYNLDGYPDILVPLIDSQGIRKLHFTELSGVSSIELWKNTPCDNLLCGPDATYEGRRALTKVTTGVDALVNIPNPYAAAFLDLDESVIGTISNV